MVRMDTASTKALTRVGFTGSRTSVTMEQLETLYKLLEQVVPFEGHHGDCIGSDVDFHRAASQNSQPVVIHPPLDEKHRAYCFEVCFSPLTPKVLAPKEFLERNKDIVHATTMLIATPDSPKEKLRSGTWSTIRYARKLGKKVHVILPDGTLQP